MTRILIFSKDRPLQLTACVESLREYLKEKDTEIRILYKTSSQEMEEVYSKMDFGSTIVLIKEVDFDHNLKEQLNLSPYILFLVDDTIFIRDFSLNDCCCILEKEPRMIGVSLRLGQNIHYSYPCNYTFQVPNLFKIAELETPLLACNWTSSSGDFNYPLEVSSSLYRSKEILEILSLIPKITNPNILEYQLSINKNSLQPLLGMYRTSRGFSIPFNSVQTNDWVNRHGTSYSIECLFNIYKEGKRIDIRQYKDFLPIGCHEEVELYLI